MLRFFPALAFAVGLFASPCAGSQSDVVPNHFPLRTGDLKSTFALTKERQALRDKLAVNVIPAGIAALDQMVANPDQVSTQTVAAFSGAVWGAGIVNYQGQDFREAVTSAARLMDRLPQKVQRDLFEAIHTLYLPLGASDPLAQAVIGVNGKKRSTRIAGMAATILVRSPDLAKQHNLGTPEAVRAWLSQSIGVEAEASTSPHVRAVLNLMDKGQPPSLALTSNTLAEILALPSPAPGHPMIFSIQGQNRDYPGFAVIRRRDGKFVRDGEGRIVLIRQLARAQTNLPGTFSNGNTPTGYMSIQGLALTTGNVFIGPAPMILTELPLEAQPERWFHREVSRNPGSEDRATSETADEWSESSYQSLLSETFRPFRSQMIEAYLAGVAGRAEILLHGNVTEPGLHGIPGPKTLAEIQKRPGNNPWAPFGPSMGCATPIELWDEKTGQCLHSDQILLVRALLAADANRDLPAESDTWPKAGDVRQPKGFLLTLEVQPPRPEGLLAADIEPVLVQAEGKLND